MNKKNTENVLNHAEICSFNSNRFFSPTWCCQA